MGAGRWGDVPKSPGEIAPLLWWSLMSSLLISSLHIRENILWDWGNKIRIQIGHCAENQNSGGCTWCVRLPHPLLFVAGLFALLNHTLLCALDLLGLHQLSFPEPWASRRLAREEGMGCLLPWQPAFQGEINRVFFSHPKATAPWGSSCFQLQLFFILVAPLPLSRQPWGV